MTRRPSRTRTPSLPASTIFCSFVDMSRNVCMRLAASPFHLRRASSSCRDVLRFPCIWLSVDSIGRSAP